MIATNVLNVGDSEGAQTKEKQLAEADDVLNVDCTEEVDEFTNFLNEFEDELKEKPSNGAEGKSNISQPNYIDGENKVLFK